jgi:tetratricopeptide (TPR) repeat protein
MPRALAVEEMRQFNKDDTKTGKAKACPKGERYSERKRDCIKTSCGTRQVWSGGVEACVDGTTAPVTDDDLYLVGRDLGQDGHYAEALKLFFCIKNREQARVLNSIGYSKRKLGDVDKGIEYYHQALAIDPNFTKARQYLGEAYLQKGDVAKARNS